jgi:hypothetical protein
MIATYRHDNLYCECANRMERTSFPFAGGYVKKNIGLANGNNNLSVSSYKKKSPGLLVEDRYRLWVRGIIIITEE